MASLQRMRAHLAAIVGVALLSWAALISLRRGTWALTGLMLGITPTVVFTMGTVNPSGLSAAGAALLVTGIASRDRGHRDSRKRLAPIWIGAAILILTRRDGALWAALIAAVAFLPHVSPRQLAAFGVQFKTRRAGVIAIPVVIASSFGGPSDRSVCRSTGNGRAFNMALLGLRIT